MTLRDRFWRLLLGDNYATDSDLKALEVAVDYLSIDVDRLAVAMAASRSSPLKHRKVIPIMASPLLQNIEADVTAARTVVQSATILVTGIQARLDAAVEAALAGGATAAQLQPVSDLSDALEADVAALSAAIAANTPTPPVTP